MDAEIAQLNASLQRGAARVARWRELGAEIDARDRELLRHRADEATWRRQAESAAEELARARGLGPTALWSRLRGRSAARIAAAEAAIAEARRKQEACDAATEPLQAARDLLASERASLDGAAAEHDTTLAAKEQWLRERRHAAVAQLDDVQARIDAVAADRRAVGDAAAFARETIVLLQETNVELSAARRTDASAALLRRAGTFRRMRNERHAAALGERAARRVADFARTIACMRAPSAAGVAAIDVGPVESALAQSASLASVQDVLQVMEQVRQLLWACERTDEALRDCEVRLRAERVACIEGAS